MLNTIRNPLFSISDLKKSPMSLINAARELGDGVYILSNNKDVGVVLDNDTYARFVGEKEKLAQINEELREKLDYMTSEMRLITNTKIYSDEDVRGDVGAIDLSNVSDEWS